ncbi:MarR family winged helix-turn-helix transcriptional regulator [Polymorphobacter sp.]|uniref:MarR family winged helix-turn-helix transcriptional regulator n=1 Tax=Polymorphobacter sp. TaxID=1909290 RepID=UPI003F6ED37C
MTDQAVLEAPDANPLAQLPGYALRRATNVMMAELAARLVPHGLRIGDASVLLVVAERTDMTSSDIGRLLDIQRANMVPLLNRLETAGLIRRQPIDRKSQAISLSPQGLEQLAEVRRVTGQFEADLLARIPPDCREAFVTALNALTA